MATDLPCKRSPPCAPWHADRLLWIIDEEQNTMLFQIPHGSQYSPGRLASDIFHRLLWQGLRFGRRCLQIPAAETAHRQT